MRGRISDKTFAPTGKCSSPRSGSSPIGFDDLVGVLLSLSSTQLRPRSHSFLLYDRIEGTVEVRRELAASLVVVERGVISSVSVPQGYLYQPGESIITRKLRCHWSAITSTET